MELLKPLMSKLERYALVVTMNREEAKDVVGETVMIAWEKFDNLKSDQAFLSYLFTIASRIYSKRQRTFIKYKINESQDIDTLYCNSLPPDVSTDVGILYKALENLPVKQKEALILYEIMGFSVKEICKIQDSGLSGVKMRLVRGRQKVADLMGVKDYDFKEDKNVFTKSLSDTERTKNEQ